MTSYCITKFFRPKRKGWNNSLYRASASGSAAARKLTGVAVMEWFNIFGLFFISIIMIPNIIYAIQCRDGFIDVWKNKKIEFLEQVGRFGCFGTMIINIPGTCHGFPSDEAFAMYLGINGVLLFLYCLIWIICFRKNSLFRALALSILPSAIFLSSGILSRSVLLTAAAVIFAPCHILISYKNADPIKSTKQIKDLAAEQRGI